MGIEMDEWRDWHAISTIQLGQLVEYGFITWDESWAWDWYDEEQRDRWQSLFEGRYWWREISIVPPIMSMSDLTIGMPMPVPWNLLRASSPSWANGS